MREEGSMSSLERISSVYVYAINRNLIYYVLVTTNDLETFLCEWENKFYFWNTKRNHARLSAIMLQHVQWTIENIQTQTQLHTAYSAHTFISEHCACVRRAASREIKIAFLWIIKDSFLKNYCIRDCIEYIYEYLKQFALAFSYKKKNIAILLCSYVSITRYHLVLTMSSLMTLTCLPNYESIANSLDDIIKSHSVMITWNITLM